MTERQEGRGHEKKNQNMLSPFLTPKKLEKEFVTTETVGYRNRLAISTQLALRDGGFGW